MKKWPLIRHVRYYWYFYRMTQHYAHWRELGYLPVHVESDLDALNDIWRGEL